MIGTAFVVAAAAAALQAPESGRAQVESTYPARGEVVAPGAFALRVTFDRPMQRGSYSFVQTRRESWPNCEGAPAQSADGRTFTLTCRAVAGRSYEIWFNRAPYLNFTDGQGRAAEPYRLTFRAR